MACNRYLIVVLFLVCSEYVLHFFRPTQQEGGLTQEGDTTFLTLN